MLIIQSISSSNIAKKEGGYRLYACTHTIALRARDAERIACAIIVIYNKKDFKYSLNRVHLWLSYDYGIPSIYSAYIEHIFGIY